MYFQSDNLNQPHSIWPTIIRIKKTLGFGSKQMADLLRMSPNEYLRFERSKKELSASSVLHLCGYLNLSFEAFMLNQFCFKTMARQFLGDTSKIPEKYEIAGKSKRRILSNLLDFVENNTDWHRRIELMQYLQINENALQDPDGTINLQCTIDAVEWLHRQYQNDSLLEKMGQDMFLAPHYNFISEKSKSARSIYELFDLLFSRSGLIFNHLEKNFIWSIQKINPGENIIISGQVNEEIRGQIQSKHIQSQSGFMVRKGIFSVMPHFLGLGKANVQVIDFFDSDETKCSVSVDISSVIKSKPHRILHLAN